MDYQIFIGRRRGTMHTVRGTLASAMGARATAVWTTAAMCVWERLSNFVKN